MITRKQYLDLNSEAENTMLVHRQYYAQFVTSAVKDVVADTFGVENLRQAIKTDQHLNNIPLRRWDALDNTMRRLCEKSVKECGDFWSLSQAVCIAKEAARQIAEQ